MNSRVTWRQQEFYKHFPNALPNTLQYFTSEDFDTLLESATQLGHQEQIEVLSALLCISELPVNDKAMNHERDADATVHGEMKAERNDPVEDQGEANYILQGSNIGNGRTDADAAFRRRLMHSDSRPRKCPCRTRNSSGMPDKKQLSVQPTKNGLTARTQKNPGPRLSRSDTSMASIFPGVYTRIPTESLSNSEDEKSPDVFIMEDWERDTGGADDNNTACESDSEDVVSMAVDRNMVSTARSAFYDGAIAGPASQCFDKRVSEDDEDTDGELFIDLCLQPRSPTGRMHSTSCANVQQ